MKTLATTLIIALGSIAPTFAGEFSVNLAIKFNGVDAKWLSDLSADLQRDLKPTENGFTLPTTSAQPGESASVELIREYRAGTTSSGIAVPCGVIVVWSPEVTDRGIQLTGKGVLRRSVDKGPDGHATQFEAKELLINLRVDDGKPASIDLVSGGQMQVIATVVDATGQPVKK